MRQVGAPSPKCRSVSADDNARRETVIPAPARGPNGVLLLEADDLRKAVPDASSDFDEANQPAGHSRVAESLGRDLPPGSQLLVGQEGFVAGGLNRFLLVAHGLTISIA